MPTIRSERSSAAMRWRWARMGSRSQRPRPSARRGSSTCAWPTGSCAQSPRGCKTRMPMAAEERTYEAAIERLEAIIRRLDSNEAGLRETLELVKEGRELIEYAAGELDAVGKGLEELKLDDLIARLEAAGPEAAPRK